MEAVKVERKGASSFFPSFDLLSPLSFSLSFSLSLSLSSKNPQLPLFKLQAQEGRPRQEDRQADPGQPRRDVAGGLCALPRPLRAHLGARVGDAGVGQLLVRDLGEDLLGGRRRLAAGPLA